VPMTTTPDTHGSLPTTIREFLAAHVVRDPAAIRAFTPTAVVVDDGRTYRGTDEIVRFLAGAGAQFTYTTELVGVQHPDDRHWVATHRLAGDFPGGVAVLDYRFTTDGDLVSELVIG